MTSCDEVPEQPGSRLRAELKTAVNRVSGENGSNTPDHVLADFLAGVLGVFDAATLARESWYGVKLAPGQGVMPSREEATRLVFEALGEASMCWENVSGAGVFQDREAAGVGYRLLMALGYQPPPASRVVVLPVAGSGG